LDERPLRRSPEGEDPPERISVWQPPYYGCDQIVQKNDQNYHFLIVLCPETGVGSSPQSNKVGAGVLMIQPKDHFWPERRLRSI
jgi:hypothetical protein